MDIGENKSKLCEERNTKKRNDCFLFIAELQVFATVFAAKCF